MEFQKVVLDNCKLKQGWQTWLTIGWSWDIAVFISSLSKDSGNGSFGSNGFVCNLNYNAIDIKAWITTQLHNQITTISSKLFWKNKRIFFWICLERSSESRVALTPVRSSLLVITIWPLPTWNKSNKTSWTCKLLVYSLFFSYFYLISSVTCNYVIIPFTKWLNSALNRIDAFVWGESIGRQVASKSPRPMSKLKRLFWKK